MKLRRPQSRRELAPRTAAAVAHVEHSERQIDPEAEVSVEDWNGIKRKTEEYSEEDKNWYHLANMGMQVAILLPGRLAELNFDKHWEKLRLKMEKYRGKNWRRFAIIAYRLFLIYPERRAELNITEEMCEGMKQAFAAQHTYALSEMTELAEAFICFFPEQRDELVFSDKTMRYMEDGMESYRGALIQNASHLYRSFVLLFPDRRGDLPIDDFCAELRSGIEAERQKGNIMYYCSLLLDLAIISADEVRITERGMELINHDKLEQTPGLPDRNLVS